MLVKRLTRCLNMSVEKRRPTNLQTAGDATLTNNLTHLEHSILEHFQSIKKLSQAHMGGDSEKRNNLL